MTQSSKGRILWVDDEIELLKPHTILLEKRGYNVSIASNGEDALALTRQSIFDLVFLDENMIGMSGLETLPRLKEIAPQMPIVMVTKNEQESVMEEAIGNKIDDYLTKPVNPAQILLACKKFLEAKRLESEKFTQEYFKSFSELSLKLNSKMDWDDWIETYKMLTKWSLESDTIGEEALQETLTNQWRDANISFSKFIEDNYFDWINAKRGQEYPFLSPHVNDKYLEPVIEEAVGPMFYFVIDGMRYDQWLVMENFLHSYYSIKTNFHCAILPTVTAYCRNSLFAGLYPIDIKKHYPQFWAVENAADEHSQNKYEKELLESWTERRRLKMAKKPAFIKIFQTEFGQKIEKDIMNYAVNELTAIVINAVDMIAHSRSDYAILKEIAPNEAAYRSLTKSWFQHSSLLGMLKQISQIKGARVVITADHGTIRCLHGVKAFGDRDTSTSLRYKFGKNVKADTKDAMQIGNIEDLKLPSNGLSVNNVIAKEDKYLIYPTEYQHYMNKYKDSFQHGGISMEEMIVPVIEMTPKKINP